MGIPETLQYDENELPFIDLGTAVIRLEREEPPPEWIKEIAQRELREIPEIVEPAIEELRRLIKNDKSLNVPLDEVYMLMFLRPCKYYPESALQRIKNFLLMRNKYGEWCEDILPDKLENVFAEEICTFFPNRDQLGRRILVLEAGKKWNPHKASMKDLFRTVQLLVLGAMLEPASQICGAIVILDMEGLPMSHLMHFTPSIAAMLLHYVQDCILVRLKAVHVVNNSYIFNILFAIFKPFIREKLRKRIFFHGKNFKTALTKHIDANVLPPKYGGTATWEWPPGLLIHEFLKFYTPLCEEFKTYGFKKDYEIPNS